MPTPIPPRPPMNGKWTESAQKVLRERYLWRDGDAVHETAEDMCWRVSYAIAEAERKHGATEDDVRSIAEQFYGSMIDGVFLPNSPTLMNAGKDNGLQFSACYVLPVEDSLDGIFESIKRAAIIHKSGGGTGFSFSRLRSKDTVVSSTGGKASGPVSFLRVFNAATEAVKQGGTRRGANMGILRIDHPDVLEFIDCKNDGGILNFNISVAITDTFMQALSRNEDYDLIDPHTKKSVGKLSARAVFDKLVDSAWRTGDPGVVFIDRINHSPANPTPEVWEIEATNPCVTGDTLVYTAGGIQRVKDLVADGRPVNAVVEEVQAPVDASPMFRTGTKPVFRLKTIEGYELRLTADHRVMTQRGWVSASDLASGDAIRLLSHGGGFGTGGSRALGRLLGWLVGDGTLTADRAVLSFFGDEKRELAPAFAEMMAGEVPAAANGRDYAIRPEEIAGRDEARVRSARFRRIAAEHGLEPGDKHKVPESVFIGSQDMQRGFLEALFTADGHVSGQAEKGVSVRLTSINRQMLIDVQRLLLNFGIASAIFSERRAEGIRSMPDGHGGQAEYRTRAYHDLVVSKDNLYRFASNVGFLAEAKQSKLVDRLASYRRGPYREDFLARFESLTPDGVEDVYDLTEPLTHSFIANGLMVHNCGEQPLAPNEACNLGSLNVAKFVKPGAGAIDERIDWPALEAAVKLSVRFLDDVIDVNPYPLPEIDDAVKANRRIGLGVMGWADMLLELGIGYDSQEAIDLASRVMGAIRHAGHEMTEELAVQRGPFPNWSRSIYKHGKPRRNSTVTTIAPTGTISIIAGCSSGVEPLFAIAYSHVAPGQNRHLTFVNPIFERVAKERGFWSEELMEQVASQGTLHDVVQIPEDIRRVFVTAHEIAPLWHVRMQGAFQAGTDNAVSKTINLPNEALHEDVATAYQLAYELGCLGITVFRDGCKGEAAQVLHLGTGGVKTEAAVAPAAAAPATIRPRPDIVQGYTRQLSAPEGKVNVTLNSDRDGLLEVFVNVGKAGSDIAALAEAVGRLVSLVLRLPSPMSPDDRARKIISQLRGIGGSRAVGFGPNQIRSLPDAVALALENHLGDERGGLQQLSNEPGEAVTGYANGHSVPNGHTNGGYANGNALGNGALSVLTLAPVRKVTGNLCPDCGCNTLHNVEGCKKCEACGYSEC